MILTSIGELSKTDLTAETPILDFWDFCTVGRSMWLLTELSNARIKNAIFPLFLSIQKNSLIFCCPKKRIISNRLCWCFEHFRQLYGERFWLPCSFWRHLCFSDKIFSSFREVKVIHRFVELFGASTVSPSIRTMKFLLTGNVQCPLVSFFQSTSEHFRLCNRVNVSRLPAESITHQQRNCTFRPCGTTCWPNWSGEIQCNSKPWNESLFRRAQNPDNMVFEKLGTAFIANTPLFESNVSKVIQLLKGKATSIPCSIPPPNYLCRIAAS